MTIFFYQTMLHYVLADSLWILSVCSHLHRMLARSIARCQRHPYKACNAADGGYDTTTTTDHVGQHLLSDGYGAKVVEFHKCLVHIHISLSAQWTLRPASVVYQHIYLKMQTDI